MSSTVQVARESAARRTSATQQTAPSAQVMSHGRRVMLELAPVSGVFRGLVLGTLLWASAALVFIFLR